MKPKQIRIFCILLLASLFSFNVLSGQTSPAEISRTPEKSGGVYYAYPGGEIKPQTPAPKGYHPFYISHLGRHGSRYLVSDRQYKGVLDIFAEGYKANALTPLGEDVYKRLCRVWQEAEGKGSALSPLGVRQQGEIAGRMYGDFPGVFSGDARISARSTTAVRCVLSMAAFSMKLKELNPALQIEMESCDKYMRYLDHYSPGSNAFKAAGEWREQYRKFEESHVKPGRLVASLFSDSGFILKKVNPKSIMWALFSIAGNMQNMETDVSFFGLFEGQELFDLWQCGNYSNYVSSANSALNKGVNFSNAKPLLENILESAESCISSGGNGTTLRFAHDGNLIPLTLLLHLEGCYESVSDPADFYKVWSNFRVSPMAANIQVVFFRREGPKGSDDILVKFLLNEKETLVPPVASDILPYYRWKDIKAFYLTALDK
jgi:hypothetical protein